MYEIKYILMSEERDQQKPAKKSLYPLFFLSLGVIIYVLLQAWVFPKIGMPS